MGINFKNGDVIRGYQITSDLINHGNFAMSYFAKNRAGRKLFFKEYIEPTPVRSWYRPFVRYQEKLKNILSSLPAGCVVESVEYFEEENIYFQVHELIEGVSLQKIMKQAADTPDSFPDSLRWDSAKLFMYDISLLHKNNIVHCDLKPDNAFMEKVPGFGIGMRIKLIDFDFSFIQSSSPADQPPWAPRDAVQGKPGYLGTPNYFSPEHLTGKTPSCASDIFTCGIILYEVLCGTYPLEGYKSAKEYLLKFVNREYPTPHELNPDIGPGLSRLMMKMLDINPEARPSAKEVHTELLSPGTKTKGPEYIKLLIGSSSNYKPVEDTAALGQSDFRAFENNKYLSSPQFKIIKDKENSCWFIEGVSGVKNNTRLNGEVITAIRKELSDGDIISVGLFKTKVAF
jgi:serine/threonine protein kinase